MIERKLPSDKCLYTLTTGEKYVIPCGYGKCNRRCRNFNPSGGYIGCKTYNFLINKVFFIPTKHIRKFCTSFVLDETKDETKSEKCYELDAILFGGLNA